MSQYLPFIATSFFLVVTLYKARQSLLIGFIFLLWSLSGLYTLVLIAGDYNFTIGIALGSFLLLALITGFPIYFASFIWGLIRTGLTLVQKEGLKIKNLLAFSLGSFLTLWLILSPFLYRYIAHPFLFALFLYISFITLYFFTLLFSFSIASWINQRPVLFKKYDYIIVLGCGLIKDQVTPLLASRIEKGIEKKKRHLKSKIIFSGGQGENESISEGEAMATYALNKGVDEASILVEKTSVNTYENLLFSKKIIDQDFGHGPKRKPKCLIVTSDFHVLRALMLGKELSFKCDGAGAKTVFYYFLNALIREFIGILYLQRKKHLLVLSFAFFILFMASVLQYYGINL